MKRLILALTVLVFVGTTAVFAHPAVDRVTGGLKDIATSPLRIHDDVKEEAIDREICQHLGRLIPDEIDVR